MRKSSSPNSLTLADSTLGPTVPWLASGILLAGLGTVLLGPLLPSLAHHWNLTDEQSGVLLLAKFFGAFCGGVSVPRRLRYGILSGTIVSCLGFGGFALSTGLLSGALTLFLVGVGIGQIIASTNILAGRRYPEHTGSTLASLNFFFSFGAVSSGLLVAALLPIFQMRTPLLYLAGLFLATGLGGLINSPPSPTPITAEPASVPLERSVFLRFALFLLLYGGLETCLTGWLTTFTLRFSDMHLLGGQSPLVLLWSALTAGRLIASAALRFVRESTVQRLGLALSAALIGGLAVAHHAATISLICILLGLALAPFFPVTFALLIHHKPSARTAGFILAVSGLGAAFFPWLMGLISTHSGSLRTAMAVPLLLAVVMLILSFLTRDPHLSPTPSQPASPA
ncbi:MAG: MFS transporter [Acidobacteriota bacterium]